MYLGDANQKTEGGEISFGAVNHDFFTGPITWAPVIRKGYWEVHLQNVTLGGQNIGVTTTRAAIDTGSSLFALPTTEADAINKKIGGRKNWSGQYVVDCDTIPSLPALSLGFGGKQFILKGEDYVLQVQSGSLDDSKSASQCVSGFMGLDASFFFKFYFACSHGLDSSSCRPTLDCWRCLFKTLLFHLRFGNAFAPFF